MAHLLDTRVCVAFAALAAVLVGIGGCAVDERLAPFWGSCEFQDLTIDARFSGGRANGCRREGDDRYAVRIEPEDTPINPSPWYAFRVQSPRLRSVVVTLSYAHSRHRYTPKLSYDGTSWFELDARRLHVSEDGSEASLRVTVGPEPLWIAAQELLTNDHYERWMSGIVSAKPFLQRRTLGVSLEGRNIDLIESAPLDAQRGTIVVLGRQHPPEVTGAIALAAFTETLFGHSSAARAFRKRYRIIVIPNLNPDGVAHGHWRHNLGGVDLNRDWGPFTQPETKLMRELLEEVAADSRRPLRLVLDFHSTWHDVMYTQYDEEPTVPEGFTAKWIAAIEARLPSYELRRDPHNSGVPSARTYVYARYGVPSITYEVGDRSDRDATRHIAREAATALIGVLE